MKRGMVLCCVAGLTSGTTGCSSLGPRYSPHDTTPSTPVSKETLEILRSVRTSDISDALDSMGLQERFQMDPAMRPLYFGIRFAGIAHTAEYKIIDRPLESMAAHDDGAVDKAGIRPTDGGWPGRARELWTRLVVSHN